jgi:hypothetical protein
MDLYWIYDLPNWLFGLLTIAAFMAFACGGLVLTRGGVRWLHAQAAGGNELVSWFLSAYGVFYGITAGLIAVATWQTFSDIESKVSQEAAALAALYQDAGAYPEPARTQLRSGLRAYTRHVLDVAWAQQRRGEVPVAESVLFTEVQDVLYAADTGARAQPWIHAETLRQFHQLVELRRLRLQAVKGGLPVSLWAVVLLGALLNLVLTWSFVAASFRLHVALTALLAGLIGLLIYLIAAMDNPFRGAFSVSPEPFRLVHEHLMAPPPAR